MGLAADGSFRSLDQMGQYDDGYSVYTGTVTVPASGRLQMRFYDSDWHAVYLDGRLVPGLSGSGIAETAAASAPAAAPRAHRLRIVYENEGRPNIGSMEQEKGVRSILPAAAGGTVLREWKLDPEPVSERERRAPEAQPAFDDSAWNAVTVGTGPQPFFHDKAISGWFRTHLQVSQSDFNRKNMELDFDGVDDNAIVFVNGKLATIHRGFDEPFVVPLDAYVHAGDNVIAVLVQNTNGEGGIVAPVTFRRANGGASLARLSFEGRLAGARAGWQDPQLDDSSWAQQSAGASLPDPAGVNWFRSRFKLPDTRGWDVPWSLDIKAAGNCQIWLNGRLVGRYFPQGPQTRFYLPSCWLSRAGAENSLVLVIRPTGNGAAVPRIDSLQVAPYTEYSTRLHHVVIED